MVSVPPALSWGREKGSAGQARAPWSPPHPLGQFWGRAPGHLGPELAPRPLGRGAGTEKSCWEGAETGLAGAAAVHPNVSAKPGWVALCRGWGGQSLPRGERVPWGMRRAWKATANPLCLRSSRSWGLARRAARRHDVLLLPGPASPIAVLRGLTSIPTSASRAVTPGPVPRGSLLPSVLPTGP